ncbi:MAG: oligosaccharide flippase family protein [Bacteroidales bacterium]|nr:oligosaccharide flippase family protein [Bacteroidales bacterium]
MKSQNIISKYREKLKNSLFFQNIAVVAGGNVTAKLIGIIAAPIITRLYTPEDYGIFSVFLSVVGVVGSLATLRYAVTIPIAKEEKLADNILKLCFLITLSLSIVWFIAIALFGNFFTFQFSAEQLQPYLWLMPVVFLGKGIYEALNNWAVRTRKFRLITRTKVSQGVSSAGVKIGLGALGVTPLGLFLGHIAQEAAGITSLFSKLVQLKPEFLKTFSWSGIKYAAKRYKKFPLVQSWSQLLLVLGAQLPVLLIGAFYGVEVVGVFGLVQNMINMPMDLIGQSVAQVYYAEISKYGKNNPKNIYKLSVSIIKKLFWVGLIPVGILLAFGPYLFKLVFGPEWLDAGVYARILSILILFRFISSPIMNCLNVLEKQGIQLWLNILRVILVFIIFYLANKVGFSPVKAMIIYSVSIAAFYLFVIIKILRLLKLSKNKV